MMTLNLSMPAMEQQLAPRITVIGVGGAGGNAVTNMIQANLEGVEFIVMNTDAQALAQSLCERRIQLGRNITQGLGAGSRPDVGRAAAEEALDEIMSQLETANMVFITAGLGGGTGTGAAPVIAQAAREAGILTVGVVTKPFHFEGVHRMRIAETGLSDLQQYVDTLIIIPNQNLFRVANEKTTFADAFKMADDVLYSGVRGVTDLMVMPGLINLDFADIRTVMTEMGKAMMGTGEGEGEQRSVAAAEAAISNPLLDDVSMKGARGVLINITGGPDLTLFEVDEAANRIRDEVDPDANIIFGSTYDAQLEGRMRVSVVATGIDVDEAVQPRPITLSLVSDRSSGGGKQAPASAATGGAVAGATAAPAPEPSMPNSAPATPTMTAAGAAPGASAAVAQNLAISEPEHEEAPEPAAEPEESEAAAVEAEVAEATAEASPSDPAEEAEVRARELEQRAAERDAFVAPPPVQPTPSSKPAPEPAAAAEPFAAAAVANGSRDAQVAPSKEESPAAPRKQRGLFARMTEAARRMQGEDTSAPQQRATERPAATREPSPSAAGRSEPLVSPPAPRPRRPAPATAANPAAEPAQGRVDAAPASPDPQPRLAGLEPSERIAPTNPEDDLLDIPAFLRRQAN
ncbi:MAG: cell division protein FtsZ [Kiloniellales bacterium]|nr:cell division protein FtsZ [Kiloniellales bacterium]